MMIETIAAHDTQTATETVRARTIDTPASAPDRARSEGASAASASPELAPASARHGELDTPASDGTGQHAAQDAQATQAASIADTAAGRVETHERPSRRPVTLYRLQLHAGFTFDAAAALAPYLAHLGVTDLYASPSLMARPGSTHGYDISDHGALSPALGGEAGHARLADALAAHRLGHLLDIVPNHMAADPERNVWWRDVLENGPSSPYARYFDIDWTPIKPELTDKVLLPILGDQYGAVLDRGELRIAFDAGALVLSYFDRRLPVNPRQAVMLFRHDLDRLREQHGDEDPHVRELLSILTALQNLPPASEREPDKVAERHREKEVARDRLALLADASPAVRAHIDAAVAAWNGTPGDPASFDRLHTLLDAQCYRLAYWRTASDEINYRRFFDVNELTGIRMEDPAVFDATHPLLLRLIADGTITGLRVDHPDGLYDPIGYADRLQARVRDLHAAAAAAAKTPDDRARHAALAQQRRPLYVAVEKILSANEQLPDAWSIYGATTYGFLNDVNGLFVDGSNAKSMRRIYGRLTGRRESFAQLMYQGKKLIVLTSLASEMNVLSHALNELSEGDRRSRDFTLNGLRKALMEVIACFPVYRTYVSARGASATDRQVIRLAVARAKWRNPAMERSIFDFIEQVLLPVAPVKSASADATADAGANADAGTDAVAVAGSAAARAAHDAQSVSALSGGAGLAPGSAASSTPNGAAAKAPVTIDPRLAFAMRFQQYTGPVHAKGVEDTAFYRYNVLASLNEVGGDPERFGRTPEEFHAANRVRLAHWAYEMIGTATHDTKRGEDARARINVLSEMPEEWRRHVGRWMRINSAGRTLVDGEPAPDRNDEYLYYQALIGAWPAEALDAPEASEAPEPFVQRMQRYMLKAVKEAKLHSSWVNENQPYEQVLGRFVERTLRGASARNFLRAFLPFQRHVARTGALNSLAQLALKLCAPGVVDLYQGTELWDLSLVDPDNRQPIDFEQRRALLDDLGDLLAGLEAGLAQTGLAQTTPRAAATAMAAATSPTPAHGTASRPPQSASPATAGPTSEAAREKAVRHLLAEWPDGRIKLLLTTLLLRLRAANPDLFLDGDYLPLPGADAPSDKHLVAFARQHGSQAIIVVAPRFTTQLPPGTDDWPIGFDTWRTLRVLLPESLAGRTFRHLLTGAAVRPLVSSREISLPAAELFKAFPLAVLATHES